MRSMENFLADGLPALVDAARPLVAVFATYNSVRGFSSGPVDAGKQGLRIVVQNGGLSISDALVTVLGLSIYEGDKHLSSRVVRQINRIGDEAQERVEGELARVEASDDPLLAVVYAGYTAFERSLDFARSLRMANRNARVIVLTCDCDLMMKERPLNAAIDAGDIKDYVVTRLCGGEDDMAAILEALVRLWPAGHPASAR